MGEARIIDDLDCPGAGAGRARRSYSGGGEAVEEDEPLHVVDDVVWGHEIHADAFFALNRIVPRRPIVSTDARTLWRQALWFVRADTQIPRR